MDIDPTTQKIHNLVLEIYSAFRNVCAEHQLSFFATSGTAAGVKFWQGFVPWDDDMDIAMPIEDFEKFRKKIHKYLPQPFVFIEIPGFGGKIYHQNTTLIETSYLSMPERYGGVFIDIVPLIGLPDDPIKCAAFKTEIKNFIAESIALDRAPNITKISHKTAHEINAWRTKLITTYPFGTTKFCTDFSCTKCPSFPTEGFLHPIEAPFENTVIPVSSLLDENLRAQYETPTKEVPKEHRQLVHHNFCVLCDLDTPYQKYANDFKNIKLPPWFQELTEKEHLLGVISTREAALTKTLYEERIAECERLHKILTEIYNSKSYRLSEFINHPISTTKTILTKKFET